MDGLSTVEDLEMVLEFVEEKNFSKAKFYLEFLIEELKK